MREYSRQLTIDDLEKPLVQSLDESIRELRDNVHSEHRETVKRLTTLESEVSTLRKELSDVKLDTVMLKRDVSELKVELKEMRREVNDIRGDIKALSAMFGTAQTRFNWGLVILGLVVAMIQLLK